VGYGEVSPLSPLGRIFTMLLILFGVGAASYTAFAAAEVLVERQMRVWVKGDRMKGKIEGLKDHIILCGYGRVGCHIAAELKQRGARVVIIEKNAERVDDLQGHWIVVGDATEDAVLKRAGVERARSLICALASGATNVFITLTAKEFNADIQITARSESESMDKKLKRAGAQRVVSPYLTGAQRMAITTLQPNVVDLMIIGTDGADQSALRLEEVLVTAGSEFIGKSLRDVEFKQRFGLMVAAIKRPDRAHLESPESDEKICDGDVLLVIGPAEKLERVAEAAAGLVTA
jgi:voltage-gated potassium channel